MSTYNDEGKYLVKIIGAALTRARSGTDQVLLTLQIEGFYTYNGLVDYPKPQFPPEVYLALTDATMGTPQNPGWVAQTLAYLGFRGDFDRLEADVVNAAAFHDATCKFETNLDGEQIEKWSILRPGGARQVAAPEKKDTRRLSSTWGDLFRKATPAQPPRPTPESDGKPRGRRKQPQQVPDDFGAESAPTNGATASQTGEDIPF